MLLTVGMDELARRSHVENANKNFVCITPAEHEFWTCCLQQRSPGNSGEWNGNAGETTRDGTAGVKKRKNNRNQNQGYGRQVLTATLLDNATTRSLIGKFPLTVPMKNLYSREMVYRFSDPLPAEQAQRSGYGVGDLSYWTPGHSLVVFYKQNGEVIDNLQKIGRFDSNLDFFQNVEATDVRFELWKE